MREGTLGGRRGRPRSANRRGPGVMFDLARPVTNWVSRNASLRVMIPRDQLDAVVPPGQIHGLVLNGGAGALLSGYLDVLLQQLDQLAPADAPYVARATRDIVAACLLPSRDRAERAAAPIAATELHAVRQYIEGTASPDVAPAKICRAVGLSRSTLYRLFERFGGVAAYIQARRLARVRALLVDPRENRRISSWPTRTASPVTPTSAGLSTVPTALRRATSVPALAVRSGPVRRRPARFIAHGCAAGDRLRICVASMCRRFIGGALPAGSARPVHPD